MSEQELPAKIINLKDNPFESCRTYGSEMFLNDFNFRQANEFTKNLSVIGNTETFSGVLELRRKFFTDEKFVDVWIPPEGYSPAVCGLFLLEVSDADLNVIQIYDHHRFKKTFHKTLFNYYLQHFNSVTVRSDVLKKSDSLCQLIFEEAKEKNHKITIISSVTDKEYDIENKEIYENCCLEFLNYSVKFYKVPQSA